MKLGKREKILGIGLSILFILLIIEKSIVTPVSAKMKSLNLKIEADEKKVEKLLYLDSQRECILKSFNGMKPSLEIGDTGEGSFSVVMKKIEEIAKDCDIVLLKMKPEAYEGAETAYEIKRVALSVEGYQRNITRFLYKLEGGEQPLIVNRLDFKVKNRKSGLMMANLDVHFISFL